MRTTKHFSRKARSLGLAVVTLALATGCSIGTDKLSDAELAARLRAPTYIVNANGTASIRNATQLNQSMSQVTGISTADTANPSVRATYLALKPRLSADGNVEAVGPSMMLAHATLASAYCRRMIDTDAAMTAATRRVFAAVDFTKDASALTPAIRAQVFKALANQILRRDLSDSEASILNDSVTETIAAIKAANNSTGAEQTKRTLLVPCTVMLGGLEFAKS